MISGQMVHARNLICCFPSRFSVAISEFSVLRGETVILNSPSGTGKSTALAMLGGLIPAAADQDAQLTIGGRACPVATVSAIRPSPQQLGIVLQTGGLIASLNVTDNICLPAELSDLNVERDWLDFLLTTLGLQDLYRSFPRQLSVGQRQRVAIARAMISKPGLLLMDEPVSALDPDNAENVERLIGVLTTETETAAIIASHTVKQGFFSGEPVAPYKLIREQDGRTTCVFSYGSQTQ